ncbi:hypothetical protein TNCV_2663221 [Trichonephila clavipes]|nr:hypothetical protein TNCV_2663221 [Trichonephila clavipes]
MHGWKTIGVVLYASSQSQLVGFPHFRLGQHLMNLNRYTNAELVDIYFIYGLANGNGRATVRLDTKGHWRSDKPHDFESLPNDDDPNRSVPHNALENNATYRQMKTFPIMDCYSNLNPCDVSYRPFKFVLMILGHHVVI